MNDDELLVSDVPAIEQQPPKPPKKTAKHVVLMVLSLLLRICGGSAAFLTAKAWGFYDPSPISATETRVFAHPYMQVVMIFVAEAMVGLFAIHKLFNKTTALQLVKNLHVFLLPVILDSFAQTFSNLGIGNELISVQQFGRLSSSIFQICFGFIDHNFRERFGKSHYIGKKILSICLVGVSLVAMLALSEGFTKGEQPDCANPLLAFSQVLLSGVFSAFYGYSTKLYQKLPDVHPLLIQSCEGFVGAILYSAIALPLLNLYDAEFPADWNYQNSHSSYIIGNQLGFLLAVVCVTMGGFMSTRYASGRLFQVIEAARPTLVMLVSFATGWEKWQTWFSLGSFVCQIAIIMGHFLYFDQDLMQQIDEERKSGYVPLKVK